MGGPADDHAGAETDVVAGPLGEGKGVALFGEHDDEGVVGEAVFFENGEGFTDLRIEVGDFGKVG